MPRRKWVHSKPIGPRQILFKYLPCFKDTCELAKNSDSNKKTVERQSRVDRLTMENIYSAKATNDREKASKEKEIKSQFDEETTKQISPQMLQAQRSELPGVESRPCWGTSRYYERLIDQSPHYTADLDLSEADALLHVFKDRKMKLSGKENVNSSCAFVSNRRRQVERMLDLPPCAVDPGDKELSDDESRTCFPEAEEKINISCVDHCFEEETDSLNFSESSNNFQSNYFDKMKDYPSHSKRHNISEHQKFGFKTNYMSDKNKHHLNNYNNEQSRFSSFSKNLSSNKRHKNSNLTDDSVYYPTKDYFKGALHSDWEKSERSLKSQY
ncbi:uncharacterized protein [Prorops nasuta]|uniref:uncharacterized protein n=1 Tax=Prorops nasuta TaxID=863751 RepID=UPI0034CD9513